MFIYFILRGEGRNKLYEGNPLPFNSIEID